jgi:hypothetical protein
MARVVLLFVALHAQWVMESSVGRYPVEDVVGITGESRTYHGVTVAQLRETKWTHVSVCGKVTLAKKEDDGDAHIRIEAGGAFAVAEIVPYHPLPMPKVGQWVRVAGISRYDKTHAWPEVHPVEAVSVVGSCST